MTIRPAVHQSIAPYVGEPTGEQTIRVVLTPAEMTALRVVLAQTNQTSGDGLSSALRKIYAALPKVED